MSNSSSERPGEASPDGSPTSARQVSRRGFVGTAAAAARVSLLGGWAPSTASAAPARVQDDFDSGAGDRRREELGPRCGRGHRTAAIDVRSLVIPGVGHWVAEQAPAAMITALSTFLAPYRMAAG
jgi:hypothetical protein